MSEPTNDWNIVLDQLAESGHQLALVVTGGGAGAISHCFRREGASRNFVEAVIPYSHGAVVDYLGEPPRDSSASPAAAIQLASVALERAARMSDDRNTGDPAGLALVAALPTTRERRGEDRIHVSLSTRNECTLWSALLEKKTQTRQSAEAIADQMILCALGHLVDYPMGHGTIGRAGVRFEQRRVDS